MIFESNRDELTHLVKSYFIDLKTGQLYSRHGLAGTDYEGGLRKINSTKKLLKKLEPFINKAKGL